MGPVTTVALPMFALVGSGYAARRVRFLDDASIVGLNGFVYFFALPALLFVRVAETPIVALFDWRLLAAWHAAGAVVFAVTMLGSRLVFRHGLATLGVRGLTATFGNVGYMGLPLALTALGGDATLPAVIILIGDIIVTVSLAIAVVEAGRGRRDGAWPQVARTIGRGLATNPLILASAAGALLSIAALPLPAPVKAFGDLLGAAALPCALFALGASLVGRFARSLSAPVVMTVAMKLVAHPLAVWLLVTAVFQLDPVWARVAVLEAALPTAATVFVLAQRYGVHVEETSSAVLLSTLLSVVTVSLLLATLG